MVHSSNRGRDAVFNQAPPYAHRGGFADEAPPEVGSIHRAVVNVSLPVARP